MFSFSKSKYHILVVVIYAFICGYFFFFTPSPLLNYFFHIYDFLLLIPLVICAFISLFIANRILHFGIVGINKKSPLQVLVIMFYALVLFAIPEEIIFRGFTQHFFQFALSNITLAIILSSLIYGVAHLLNGAKGFKPQEWNWKLVGMTFIVGLYLGFAYFVTGSLVIPTILHTLFIIASIVFIKD